MASCESLCLDDSHPAHPRGKLTLSGFRSLYCAYSSHRDSDTRKSLSSRPGVGQWLCIFKQTPRWGQGSWSTDSTLKNKELGTFLDKCCIVKDFSMCVHKKTCHDGLKEGSSTIPYMRLVVYSQAAVYSHPLSHHGISERSLNSEKLNRCLEITQSYCQYVGNPGALSPASRVHITMTPSMVPFVSTRPQKTRGLTTPDDLIQYHPQPRTYVFPLRYLNIDKI